MIKKLTLLITLAGFICSSNRALALLPPSASFVSPDTAFCGSGHSHFVNFSTNATHYLWYFGDGQSDTAKSPNHYYNSPGEYTVKLLVTNGITTDSLVKTKYVKVYATPIVTITASDTNLCLHSFDTLTGNGAVTYNWYPGNTAGARFIVSPSVQSVFKVVGTSGPGCKDSTTIVIHVLALPNIKVGAAQSSICEGDSATLTATGGTRYSWQPISSSVSAHIKVSPSVLTTYNVKGTDTHGCSDTASVTVGVYSNPIILIVPTSTHICLGSADTLMGSGGVTYTWSPGVDTTSEYIITPAATTTYYVTGKDIHGCIGKDSTTITVNALPVATAGKATTICFGSTAVIGSAPKKGNSYVWSPPGNITNDTFATTGVNPPFTTTYTLTVTNRASGCMAVDSVLITVDSLPAFTFWDTAICPGHPLVLGPPSKRGYSYKWTPATGLSSTTVSNPTCTAANPTIYTLVMKDSGTGCFIKDSSRVAIYIVDSLYPITGKKAVHAGDTTGYAFLGLPGFIYQWNVRGATIINGQGTDTITVIWKSAATDTIKVWSTNACTDSVSLIVNISTSSLSLKAPGAAGLNIYPNPAADLIHFKILNSYQGAILAEIMDVTGRALTSIQLADKAADKAIHVGALPSGMYFLRVKLADGNMATERFTISR